MLAKSLDADGFWGGHCIWGNTPFAWQLPEEGILLCWKSPEGQNSGSRGNKRFVPEERDIILAHCTHCACPCTTKTTFLPVWTAPLKTAPLGFCFVCFVKFLTWHVSGVNNSPCPIWSWGCSCFSSLPSYTDPGSSRLAVPLLTKVSLVMACHWDKDTDWVTKHPLDSPVMRSQWELMITRACETNPSPTGNQPPATIGKIPIQRSVHGVGRRLQGTLHSYVF